MNRQKADNTKALKDNLEMILEENLRLANNLNYEDITLLSEYLKTSNRIFVKGVGRSGLALSGFAMRLIHLGFHASIVGEISAPAISEGDLLLVASGSGTTHSVIKAAQKAKAEGANVVCYTTDENSELAKISDQTILLPASSKYDYGEKVSKQYAGTLFEQALSLLCDAIFHTLWQQSGQKPQIMFKRHSNLE
ncbi:6-phospho 3-hexuloisomerase [Pseudopedobacter saltans DSM 12145]|uniref:6-phospho 3-hexuloisomerase n=1 Tax=Pseudopedobacter saltans (strain ATCC 51119 / DSM 12145 / JCM 21818 / CCUG 39354 / LMG 10337 / NBRC 100064 / NCIMB 13643) TaxID=762903 RepID=F0SBM3_PSESL|nr:6-phospho-3-hexuloisomerase [Pseudopedobacter saltans]ADY52714.1 6-phospho 3-hexuloisomerase [Pseudopedobacter saltans DSM 12145]